MSRVKVGEGGSLAIQRSFPLSLGVGVGLAGTEEDVWLRRRWSGRLPHSFPLGRGGSSSPPFDLRVEANALWWYPVSACPASSPLHLGFSSVEPLLPTISLGQGWYSLTPYARVG